MTKSDYVADRRQHLSDGRRNPTSGGWMVMHWSERHQIYVEGATYATKRAALESIREDKARSSAAAALGARGGSAGTGDAKRRGTDHYREMARRSAVTRRKAE